MRIFGLIGKPLGHSFSGAYFAKKFEKEQIEDAQYNLYELEEIEDVKRLLDNSDLRGLNVTIPYKESIGRYMDEIDETARRIGAINVVRIDTRGVKKGFNSDYYGFQTSLVQWIPDISGMKALVLGTGGSSKAVVAALQDLGIAYTMVSRSADKGLTYRELHRQPTIVQNHQLIVNTTPLGMSPNTNRAPDIPFSALSGEHYLYDLIYNPEETLFMAQGRANNALVKNGKEMLLLQAEKSWEIWNS
jgi:shikimate dehydrogenase